MEKAVLEAGVSVYGQVHDYRTLVELPLYRVHGDVFLQSWGRTHAPELRPQPAGCNLTVNITPSYRDSK